MPQSLRRQKILFERTLQRLVNEGVYVKTEEGYGLREQAKLPDNKYKTIIDRKKTFDERIKRNLESFSKSPILKEFADDFPDYNIN